MVFRLVFLKHLCELQGCFSFVAERLLFTVAVQVVKDVYGVCFLCYVEGRDIFLKTSGAACFIDVEIDEGAGIATKYDFVHCCCLFAHSDIHHFGVVFGAAPVIYLIEHIMLCQTFPAWEQNIPSVGIIASPIQSYRVSEVTAHCPRDYGSLPVRLRHAISSLHPHFCKNILLGLARMECYS